MYLLTYLIHFVVSSTIKIVDEKQHFYLSLFLFGKYNGR